jgi:hypothetical protein
MADHGMQTVLDVLRSEDGKWDYVTLACGKVLKLDADDTNASLVGSETRCPGYESK